jgi:hypothetical protein
LASLPGKSVKEYNYGVIVRAAMKQKTKKNKRYVYVGCAILAAILIGGAAWAWQRHHGGSTSTTSGASNSSGSSTINYGPPTETEKQDSQNAKDQIVQQENNQSQSDSGKKPVNVSVIYADRNSVRAQVTGVFENTGTCTATATSAAAPTVTKSSGGVENVSYTNCSLISWNLSGSGPWKVTVSYDSPDASGTSQPYTVN